jgi:transcriptional regulator with XRE-family HTH domain
MKKELDKDEELENAADDERAGFLKTFSYGFKNFLERKKFNTKDLALKLGVTDSAVSSWKYGKVFPDVPNLIKLMKLGLSPCEILDSRSELQTRISDCEMRIERNKMDLNFMRGRSRYSGEEAQLLIAEIEREISELNEQIEDYKRKLDSGSPLDNHPC